VYLYTHTQIHTPIRKRHPSLGIFQKAEHATRIPNTHEKRWFLPLERLLAPYAQERGWFQQQEDMLSTAEVSSTAWCEFFSEVPNSAFTMHSTFMAVNFILKDR